MPRVFKHGESAEGRVCVILRSACVALGVALLGELACTLSLVRDPRLLSIIEVGDTLTWALTRDPRPPT